jgi:hypothetical protein
MSRILATVVATVIESLLGVVDRVLAGVPNPVPSSGQLRQLRSRGRPIVIDPVRRARRPLLAAIGTADLLADRTRRIGGGIELPVEYGPAVSQQWSRVVGSASDARQSWMVTLSAARSRS